MDRYMKLTRALPTTKTITATSVCIILEHCVENYRIPSKLPTDNGTQFMSKIFVEVRSTLEVSNITTRLPIGNR